MDKRHFVISGQRGVGKSTLIEKLLREIEEARAENNDAEIQRLEDEMTKITAAINEAVGLGGKLRKSNDKRKNIRDAFRSAVNRAITYLEKYDKPLAAHFPDDEVGQLAEALDAYALRLTEVVQRDREFNADVSHELRTPLAIIRGSVELMLSRPDMDEKTRTRIQRIQRAEQQCTDLISALLLLSRNERGHGNTDVARVVDQLLDAHRATLGGKPLTLRVEGEEGARVDSPEAALSVALGNLIGNAVKYTKEGEVVVRLLPDAVEVVDSGPGLSKEDAARLFERGYRGTHAGHSQGGGIGLSIVSRLCALYGWEVGVRPGESKGVVATLRFSPTREASAANPARA